MIFDEIAKIWQRKMLEALENFDYQIFVKNFNEIFYALTRVSTTQSALIRETASAI
jgi:hypothetical protein